MGEPVGDTDVATSVEASLLRGFPETATGKVGKIETREAPVETSACRTSAARSTPDTAPGVGQEPTAG